MMMLINKLIVGILTIFVLYSCKQTKKSDEFIPCFKFDLSKNIKYLIENTILGYNLSKDCYLTLHVYKVSPDETLITIRPYYKVSEDYNKFSFFCEVLENKIFLKLDLDEYVINENKELPKKYEYKCVDFIAKQYIVKSDSLFEIENYFDIEKNEHTKSFDNSVKGIYLLGFNNCEHERFSSFKANIQGNIRFLEYK